MREKCHAGFTLIELMATMAIIAILTAIAIPNYAAYIQRSSRGEARGQLLEGATWMERWRTERGRYDDPASAGNPPPTFPATYLQSRRDGRKVQHCVATTAATDTLTATPTGSMAGDVCGDLVINQSGQRLFTGGGGTRIFAGTASRPAGVASWPSAAPPAVLTVDPSTAPLARSVCRVPKYLQQRAVAVVVDR